VNGKLLINLYKMIVKLEKQFKELSERSEFSRQWLTVSDIKAIYGISRKVFDSYRSRGLKVRQDKPNGKILISKSELEKFLLKK